MERELEKILEDIQTRDTEMSKNTSFEITFQGIKLTGHKVAGETLRSIIENRRSDCYTKEEIGIYKGFRVLLTQNSLISHLDIVGRNTYALSIQSSDIGNMIRLENLINGLDKSAELCREKIESCRSEMKNAEMEYEKPFQYEEQLKAALKRQVEINIQLEIRDHDDRDIEMPEKERQFTRPAIVRNSI